MYAWDNAIRVGELALVQRSELKRKTPMRPSQTCPKPSSRSQQPKRSWTAAREKIQQEGGCRLAYRLERYCAGPIQAAHIIGRSHDAFTLDGEPLQTKTWMVEPDRIIPLCETHHRWLDAHEQDILQALTLQEQIQAVRDAGGIENARIRTAPLAYKRFREAE